MSEDKHASSLLYFIFCFPCLSHACTCTHTHTYTHTHIHTHTHTCTHTHTHALTVLTIGYYLFSQYDPDVRTVHFVFRLEVVVVKICM